MLRLKIWGIITAIDFKSIYYAKLCVYNFKPEKECQSYFSLLVLNSIKPFKTNAPATKYVYVYTSTIDGKFNLIKMQLY